MKKIFKKRLAVLLAAALMMSSSTVAYAEEAVEVATAAADETDGSLDAAEVVELDEAAVDEASDAADVEVYEDKKTVSDPTANPETWGKDLYNASYTYMLYLPELLGYEDRDMISTNQIVNNESKEKAAITGDDIWRLVEASKFYNSSPQGFNINSISFDCIHIEGDTYVVYAYGIDNDFDGADYYNAYYNDKVDLSEARSPSRNNYYGMDLENTPAGVFDYTPFTWYGKSAGVGGNGKIIYEAAVIEWSSGQKPEKQRIYKLSGLKCKNNIYATVSFCAIDGKWKKVSNYFNKKNKQPSFYPQFTVKKSYRDENGKKIKPTKEEKKFKKTINTALKNNKIEFEIRRRPIAASSSWNYIEDDTWRYASLIGDELEFKDSGKLKTGKLQFKSRASVKETDIDSDSGSDEEEEAGKGNSSAQVAEYYLTHTLKMNVIPKKDISSDANFIKDMEEKIQNETYKRKTKTDAWYTTKKVGGENTLIVIGAKNLEGVAAFRSRPDRTIGKGYYESDTDCYITEDDK